MNILGLNAYHADAAACLVRDGDVVAAAEEERFQRVKHWAGLPVEASAWCLEEAGLSLAEIDILAVNRDPGANLGKKILYAGLRRPSPHLVIDRIRNSRDLGSVATVLEAALAARRAGAAGQFTGSIRRVEHHLAHHASSFLVSSFDEAALLSLDGFGDFTSASWGKGTGSDIRLNGRVYFPHSLGVFYMTLTQYLGFPNYGDEYKVMGLAPFGQPRYLDALRKVIRIESDGTFRLDLRFFRHHRADLNYTWQGGSPTVLLNFTVDLEALLGPARLPEDSLDQRHKDIARSAQARFEEVALALLGRVYESAPCEAIALSGGAAMNSVLNGRVIADSPFERVFIPPAPGDSGGAIGAALVAWYKASGARRGPPMLHSHCGPGFSAEVINQALAEHEGGLDWLGCTTEMLDDERALCEATAFEIAAGKVVGWFQGRMEFGPRALGHRSILCDPRRADMRDRINAKIKLRESFRPFAPSVLRERMAEWFEVDDDVPFMMKVYGIRADRRNEIPAVTHVDGSGRPQTVTAEAQPLFYRLIEAFERQTSVPMVLNTSFNENEPIVHRPGEALDCFLRTDMDALVLGPFMIRKPAETAGS